MEGVGRDRLSRPVRLPDLAEHVRGLGFSDFTIPLPVGVFRFMATSTTDTRATETQMLVGGDGLWLCGEGRAGPAGFSTAGPRLVS